jgi:translation initiation factor 1 (eIF-1/SUI1)
VTLPRETLSRIDDAIARFDKALEAIRKIPRQGQEAVTVNGIEHELIALAKRLQSLRDEVAGDGTERGG